MKFLLLMLALAVSLSMGGHPTAMGDVTNSRSNLQDYDYNPPDPLWSQLPTGNPMASQYFTDLYPDWDAGIANDFMFPVDIRINIIHWWGGYWNTSEPLPIVAPVEIYIYFDDGTQNAPTLPQHTSAIQSWMIDVGDYDEVADGDNYLCIYEFPEWIWFEADVIYWIEIRKAYAFDPYGQYGWIASEPVYLSYCVQGFDGLGIDWWTLQDTDAAFELFFEFGALQPTTWGEIKTIF